MSWGNYPVTVACCPACRDLSGFGVIALFDALEREKAKGRVGHVAENLVRLELVILDEPGYLPISASGGALLFHA